MFPLNGLSLDKDRLPRLTEHQQKAVDNSDCLSELPWGRDEQIPLLYLAPSGSDTAPSPQSITVLPPPGIIDADLFWRLLAPRRPSIVLDMRQDVTIFPEASDDSLPSRFMGHYFPIRIADTHPRHQMKYVDPPWSPRGLQGLWLGAYSSDGTEVLFLKWEDDVKEVQAWKVTGNCCVPRGALSWKFSASAPIPAHDMNLLTEIGITDQDKSELRMFEGSGIIADEGFM